MHTKCPILTTNIFISAVYSQVADTFSAEVHSVATGSCEHAGVFLDDVMLPGMCIMVSVSPADDEHSVQCFTH